MIKAVLNSSAMLEAECLQKFVIVELQFQEQHVVMARMGRLLVEKEQAFLPRSKFVCLTSKHPVGVRS